MAKRTSYREIAEIIRQQWIATCTEEGSRLPTERELQMHLGVSRVTVSRAMHLLAEQGIIEQRRGSGSYIRRINAALTPKPTLGFIAPYIAPAGVYSGPLPSLVHMGIDERATELGYQVIAAASHFVLDTEAQMIDHFRQSGAAGIVLMPVTTDLRRTMNTASQDPLSRRWRDMPIAIVDLGAPEWGRPIVGINNYRLGYDMTCALIRHGHQRILFMDTDHTTLHQSIHQRRAGYLRAMEAHGLPVPPAYRQWPLAVSSFRPELVLRLTSDGPDILREPDPAKRTEASVAVLGQIVESLLHLSPRPDAVIAWEDATAMGLIRLLIDTGVQVPNDIRVAGFDNHVQGRTFQPAFPTSNPDLQLMGQYAVDLVDQMITGHVVHPSSVQLPAPILWRE